MGAQRLRRRPVECGGVPAQDLDPAGRGADQADDAPQQDGFARPRSADDAHDLAREHVQVGAVMDHLTAEPGLEAAHPDDRLVHRRHTPRYENRIENPASATITRKIDSTTD